MIFTTFLLILGSIFVSTGLILANKKVLSVYKFGCPIFLTSYHFLLLSILLHIMSKLKFIEVVKVVPKRSIWLFAFFGVLSIVMMNFNLKLNSIGFYQLSKLCNIPCIVVYKYFFENQTTPYNTLLSLCVLLIGLFFFTVNDVQFNLIGSIVAAVAVFSTAFYQTQTGSLQKQYQVTGIQLNRVTSFPQFIIGIICSFLLETHGENSIFQHQFAIIEFALIFASGLFAVIGNIIAFSLIGKAGPVTFQVVGHVKSMLIFIFGLIMFPAQQESSEQFQKKIIGLSISMVGVIIYTIFEIQNKKENEKNNLANQPVEDEPKENDPLLPKNETPKENV